MNTERGLWCELQRHYVERHGVSELDPLQRLRFVEHVRTCAECSEAVDLDGPTLTESPERIHFSDATLRELAQFPILAEGMSALQVPELARHLKVCGECRARLEAVTEGERELTEQDEPASDVLARSRLTALNWTRQGGQAELRWLVDTPLVQRSLWTVRLQTAGDRLHAQLLIDALETPPVWQTFSVAFATNEGFYGSVVFSPHALEVIRPLTTANREDWTAMAIMVGPRPAWISLVSFDETFDALRSVTRPHELVLRVPQLGDLQPAQLERRVQSLAALVEDVRGKGMRLQMLEGLPHPSGNVVTTEGEHVAHWSARLEHEQLTVRIAPRNGAAFWVTEHSVEAMPGLEVAETAVAFDVRPAPKGLPRVDWWRATASGIGLKGFRPEVLVAFSGHGEARAAAASATIDLVARLGPGRRIVVRLNEDGLGEVVNDIQEHDQLAIVLANSNTGQVVEWGLRGHSQQNYLVVPKGTRLVVWCDRRAVAEGDLVFGAFAPSDHR